MKFFYNIYSISKADFLERIRRTSFLIILGLTVWTSSVYVPPTDALTGMHVKLSGYRGLYNSAWIGSSTAICTILFLSVLGFYLVKDTIERDTYTKVGQIIAATPVKNFVYLLGKLFSNFMVLASISIVTAISAGAMQLIRGEVMTLDFWNLISPYLIIVLPAMFIVSAIAVFFECIWFLSGTLGNILYFICIWPAMVMSSTSSTSNNLAAKLLDPLGITIPVQSMSPIIKSFFAEYNGSFSASYTTLKEPLKVFVWTGIEWNIDIVLIRLIWVALSLVIILIASLFFNRFNPNIRKLKQRKEKKSMPVKKTDSISNYSQKHLNAANITVANKGFSFLSILRAEITLTVKNSPKWLFLIILALIITSIAAPIEVVKGFIFPALLILPIPLWADLGSRERSFNTTQLIFSAPYAVKYQLTARFLTGVIIAFIPTISFGIRVSLISDFTAIVSLISCIAFIPTLSLVCGIWSGTSRTFEVLYTTLWYLGPCNKLSILDYTHIITNSANTINMYLLITLFMIIISVLGRRKQVLYS